MKLTGLCAILCVKILIFAAEIHASESLLNFENWNEHLYDFQLTFFTPDGAIINAKLDSIVPSPMPQVIPESPEESVSVPQVIPKDPKEVIVNVYDEYIPSLNFNHVSIYYEAAESIQIFANEFTIHPDDKLIISLKSRGNDIPVNVTKLNLAKSLVHAAVFAKNPARLDRLISLKAHTGFSDETKAEILLTAIYSYVGGYSGHCENIQILLSNGFHNFDDDVYESKCPYYHALKCPEITETFLAYDPDFFKKQVKCNYVTSFIKNREYEFVDRALEVGCDASIQVNGTNALDEALEIEQFEPSETLKKLIRKLKKKYGVKMTLSFQNFVNCCSSKRFTHALVILKHGNLSVNDQTWSFDSPLSVAIESEDTALIEYAVDHFLIGLNPIKLYWALRFAEINTNRDESVKLALSRAQLNIVRYTQQKTK